MDLNTWLDAERGRLQKLADHFKLTKGAVSQWRHGGVPRNRMLEVRRFTGGVVDLDGMLPKPKVRAVVQEQADAPAASERRYRPDLRDEQTSDPMPPRDGPSGRASKEHAR